MNKINVPRFLAKEILELSQYFDDNKLILVCKGYDEDFIYYTGLYWEDDKDLDLFDETYSDFQLWHNLKN